MSTSLPTPFGYGTRVKGGDQAWIAIGQLREAFASKRHIIADLDLIAGYFTTLEARYEPFRRAMRDVAADTDRHDRKDVAKEAP